MSRSYIIGANLEDKIGESKLLEKYPELSRQAINWFFAQEDLDRELLDNPYALPKRIRNDVFRILANPLSWEMVSEDIQDGDLFWKSIKTLTPSLHDLALGTWYNLPNPFDDEEYGEEKEFDAAELEKYQEYGFDSVLDMVMSLSAYRFREVIKWQRKQYEWTNSQGIKNVITACVHGDPKFFQYQELPASQVYSPFWNMVDFAPRNQIWAMTQVHHSHEPGFFATFFRYAYECWKLGDIIWERGEKFIKWSDNLPWMLWNFWDAGSGSYMDSVDMMWRICVPIWGDDKHRNVHLEWFWPNHKKEDEDTYYEFKTTPEWNLELYNAQTGRVDVTYYPEDCEDLLKGILHQCAYGHGRTSKTQILNLVRYVYSEDFKEHIADLSGLEMPNI